MRAATRRGVIPWTGILSGSQYVRQVPQTPCGDTRAVAPGCDGRGDSISRRGPPPAGFPRRARREAGAHRGASHGRRGARGVVDAGPRRNARILSVTVDTTAWRRQAPTPGAVADDAAGPAPTSAPTRRHLRRCLVTRRIGDLAPPGSRRHPVHAGPGGAAPLERAARSATRSASRRRAPRLVARGR